MMDRTRIRSLREVRAGKPPAYPDQTVYAEYACGACGLNFRDIDGGSGLVFLAGAGAKQIAFGAGRCSLFPQNNATATTLAADKYFANVVLEHAGLRTLGGQYFFLHDRHRAHRGPGHERTDARAFLQTLNGTAFVKPLAGSRGDFAQAVNGDSELAQHLDKVARYYDAVLIQPIMRGREYRIFVLDDDIVYSARKHPATVTGDGEQALGSLLAAHNAALDSRGISPAASDARNPVPAAGERVTLAGRMNRSAGGAMAFETPEAEQAAFALARAATRALGLRAAGVDIFTHIDGGPAETMAIIEVNANPSIRFLEDSDRPDLILQIWKHTFITMGLLGV